MFHYFGNKKRLFLYIIDYILDNMLELINQELTNPPSDIFERIIQIGLVKLKIAYRYPLMYKVLINAFHVPEDLQKEIQIRYDKIYQTSLPLLYKNIDTSQFRKDIDHNKAIELIFAAIEGLSNKWMRKCKNMTAEEVFAQMPSILEEYYQYVDILKCGVYTCGRQSVAQESRYKTDAF